VDVDLAVDPSGNVVAAPDKAKKKAPPHEHDSRTFVYLKDSH
jgi:hypothetical protein